MMATKNPYNNPNVACKFTMNLIAAVKGKPCIYSKKHQHYRDQSENDFAWFNVAQTVKRSPTECVDKWFFILQRYLYRERLKSKGLQIIYTERSDAYKALDELKPFMVESYEDLISGPIKKSFNAKIPMRLQEALIKEIKLNSKILNNELTTNDRRQEIWAAIALNLNKTELYAELPIIHWQKAWWDLKSAVREKLERTTDALSLVDKVIILACGIRSDNTADIIKGLKGFTEFDIFVCPTDVKVCSICNNSPPMSIYKTANWSPAAKELIPVKCRSKNLLLACMSCNLSLKQRASLAWKACRICGDTSKPVHNFLDNNIKPLIIAFRGISKLPLSQSEGLPSYICDSCVQRLTEIRDFCEMCAHAQSVFQKDHQRYFVGGNESSNRVQTPKPILIDENTPIIFEDSDDLIGLHSPKAPLAPTVAADSTDSIADENDYEVVFIEPPPAVLNQSQPQTTQSPQKLFKMFNQKAVVNLKRLRFKTNPSHDQVKVNGPLKKMTKPQTSVNGLTSAKHLNESAQNEFNTAPSDSPDPTEYSKEYGDDISDIITVCDDEEDLFF